MRIRGCWVGAEAESDRVALIDADGRRFTSGELLTAGNRLVHALRARGLGPGDSVALLLPNGAPFLELLLATMQAGWHVTPLNSHLSAEEIAYIVADSGARAFIAHEDFAEQAVTAAARAGLSPDARIAVGHVRGFAAWDEVLGEQPNTQPANRLAGQFMQYTSGTTGRVTIGVSSPTSRRIWAPTGSGETIGRDPKKANDNSKLWGSGRRDHRCRRPRGWRRRAHVMPVSGRLCSPACTTKLNRTRGRDPWRMTTKS